jgi:hypothetical protein
VNFLQRRRARLLINRAQPFADEPLLAVANFTWVGNSMGAPRLQKLPGFDNESFIRAMGVSDESICSLWRR